MRTSQIYLGWVVSSDEYKKEQTPFYIYVPYGFAKWMLIEDFVDMSRRTADWIRFNNNDLYSRTLDHYCELYDNEIYDDEEDSYF